MQSVESTFVGITRFNYYLSNDSISPFLYSILSAAEYNCNIYKDISRSAAYITAIKNIKSVVAFGIYPCVIRKRKHSWSNKNTA